MELKFDERIYNGLLDKNIDVKLYINNKSNKVSKLYLESIIPIPHMRCYYATIKSNLKCIRFDTRGNSTSTYKVFMEYNEIKTIPEITKNLKPFDKVLVRDANEIKWSIDLFSHIDNDEDEFIYICMRCKWKQCIPYEGNESLLNTTRY